MDAQPNQQCGSCCQIFPALLQGHLDVMDLFIQSKQIDINYRDNMKIAYLPAYCVVALSTTGSEISAQCSWYMVTNYGQSQKN
jgi:hypothetical protein